MARKLEQGHEQSARIGEAAELGGLWASGQGVHEHANDRDEQREENGKGHTVIDTV